MITFETKLTKIKDWTILHIPPESSAQLPSRGMTMVSGTINGIPFKTLLEPDGNYLSNQKPSHWFKPDTTLLKKISKTAGLPAQTGDTVSVSMESTKDWIEPELPEDMKYALDKYPTARKIWEDITPLARWDWVRWVRAVKTEETRKKHVEVMLDKLNKGMLRPCCFNRSLCSEPYVSYKWRLLDPEKTR